MASQTAVDTSGDSAVASEAAALLLTGVATAMQGVGMQGGGGGEGNEVEMTGADPNMRQVLSGLQQTESSSVISSVLPAQPQVFTDDLGVVVPTGVSTDPESLRFQYPLDNPPVPKKKTPPTVYREQDRFLPINNVSRVMRNAIPRTGKVSKDAKECMQECVSEFVSFITSEAADRCSQEKRKTLTGDDVLFAMATLGFDNYIQPMKLYLQKIREYMKVEKGMPAVRERVPSHQLTTPTPLLTTPTPLLTTPTTLLTTPTPLLTTPTTLLTTQQTTLEMQTQLQPPSSTSSQFTPMS